VKKAVQVFIDDKYDVAAFATVAAAWPAAGNMLFTSETNHTVSASAAADVNFCLIVEHREVYSKEVSLFKKG
jgi:hypothetical protein